MAPESYFEKYPTEQMQLPPVPPDDWNEDYIDDDEIDETMLMIRPPLPPKK